MHLQFNFGPSSRRGQADIEAELSNDDVLSWIRQMSAELHRKAELYEEIKRDAAEVEGLREQLGDLRWWADAVATDLEDTAEEQITINTKDKLKKLAENLRDVLRRVANKYIEATTGSNEDHENSDCKAVPATPASICPVCDGFLSPDKSCYVCNQGPPQGTDNR